MSVNYINLKSFHTFKLHHDVISCSEAAVAKGIPLENELKSLILTTSKGLYVLNIPGNENASLRSVKNALDVDEALLANIEQLSTLQVQPGTVCPFLPQLWCLPQLISKDILKLSFVSTNNGTKNQYIIFCPKLLLQSERHIIGCFSKIFGGFNYDE
ncbi:MAG: YbaK/EbsC family protein [Lentimicrobiaceae bacterium]|nr:YbaK/EbsC family protein [Lentimicrobiaceae bacterium]